VQAIRAREQGLRWMLSRRHPEKYGDKVEVKSNGPGFVGIVNKFPEEPQ
jgi:hypothetical protein